MQLTGRSRFKTTRMQDFTYHMRPAILTERRKQILTGQDLKKTAAAVRDLVPEARCAHIISAAGP